MSITKAIGLFLLLIFVIIGAYYFSIYVVNFTYYDIYLPLYHIYIAFMTLIHDLDKLSRLEAMIWTYLVISIQIQYFIYS